MKKVCMIAVTLLLIMAVAAQEEVKEKKLATLPSVDIRTLEGKVFNTKDIVNDGKPMIISFWTTTCKPCIAELKAIADVYDDWVEETGVKLFAISVDDSRSSAKVAPFVNGQSWDYKVLLDANQDFKRAMNIGELPFLCILNGKGEIVWQHTSYATGSEEEVYKIIKDITTFHQK